MACLTWYCYLSYLSRNLSYHLGCIYLTHCRVQCYRDHPSLLGGHGCSMCTTPALKYKGDSDICCNLVGGLLSLILSPHQLHGIKLRGVHRCLSIECDSTLLRPTAASLAIISGSKVVVSSAILVFNLFFISFFSTCHFQACPGR